MWSISVLNFKAFGCVIFCLQALKSKFRERRSFEGDNACL